MDFIYLFIFFLLALSASLAHPVVGGEQPESANESGGHCINAGCQVGRRSILHSAIVRDGFIHRRIAFPSSLHVQDVTLCSRDHQLVIRGCSAVTAVHFSTL